MPETVLKARKRRDDLRVAVNDARKTEKAQAKLRRAGELKRAEAYMKGAWGVRAVGGGAGGLGARARAGTPPFPCGRRPLSSLIAGHAPEQTQLSFGA